MFVLSSGRDRFSDGKSFFSLVFAQKREKFPFIVAGPHQRCGEWGGAKSKEWQKEGEGEDKSDYLRGERVKAQKNTKEKP